MEPAEVRPVTGYPILELLPPGRRGAGFLVVADLHLGLGSPAPGLPSPPGATPAALARELTSIARRRHAAGVIFAGDVKQPIVGASPPLRRELFDFFSHLLSAGLSTEVVLGNHDVGLARCLPREVSVHSALGLSRWGVGVFHGHAWPSNRVLRSRTLVAGHLHPGYRFAPSEAARETKVRCWLRVDLPLARPSRRRRRHGPVLARELIVLPALNPLTGTEALNRHAPARARTFLWKRFVLKGVARAYLLDGTDLGVVSPSPGEPRAGGSRRRDVPGR